MITKVNMYDTDIGFLFSRMKENTIFVSDWENGNEELNIEICPVLKKVEEDGLFNKYIYSRDLRELKNTVCNYIKGFSNADINDSNIMISSNASISGLLTAIYSKKNLTKKKILIIGPIYFTYVHMFLEFGFEIYNFKVDIFSNNKIDTECILKFIEKERIGLVLIINPLYRTGIEVPLDTINELCRKTESLDCMVVIDEAYGNFSWNIDKRACCNIPLVEISLKYKNTIVFDSLAKRVFANGMKSSIIFGNENAISLLEKDSVIYSGSLSCIQASFLKYLYTDGKACLENIMKKSLDIARTNYFFYIEYIQKWKRMKISKVNCGYFALIGIPKDKFESQEEDKIAIELMEKENLLIIPYSRYNYYDEKYMFFSINLLMNRDKVKEALSVLGDLYC